MNLTNRPLLRFANFIAGLTNEAKAVMWVMAATVVVIVMIVVFNRDWLWGYISGIVIGMAVMNFLNTTVKEMR